MQWTGRNAKLGLRERVLAGTAHKRAWLVPSIPQRFYGFTVCLFQSLRECSLTAVRVGHRIFAGLKELKRIYTILQTPPCPNTGLQNHEHFIRHRNGMFTSKTVQLDVLKYPLGIHRSWRKANVSIPPLSNRHTLKVKTRVSISTFHLSFFLSILLIVNWNQRRTGL